MQFINLIGFSIIKKKKEKRKKKKRQITKQNKLEESYQATRTSHACYM